VRGRMSCGASHTDSARNRLVSIQRTRRAQNRGIDCRPTRSAIIRGSSLSVPSIYHLAIRLNKIVPGIGAI
jgi:hypothetical protein